MVKRYAQYPHWEGLERSKADSQTIQEAIDEGGGGGDGGRWGTKNIRTSESSPTGSTYLTADGSDDHAQFISAIGGLPS